MGSNNIRPHTSLSEREEVESLQTICVWQLLKVTDPTCCSSLDNLQFVKITWKGWGKDGARTGLGLSTPVTAIPVKSRLGERCQSNISKMKAKLLLSLATAASTWLSV